MDKEEYGGVVVVCMNESERKLFHNECHIRFRFWNIERTTYYFTCFIIFYVLHNLWNLFLGFVKICMFYYYYKRVWGMFVHSRMCQSSRINVSQGLQTCISISENIYFSSTHFSYISYEFILVNPNSYLLIHEKILHGKI